MATNGEIAASAGECTWWELLLVPVNAHGLRWRDSESDRPLLIIAGFV